ncbi:MAG: hypothetical protein CVU13_04685 [Bacteroidetes bacterium HGW-Bacteroidetes-8]|jgi:hypothetical protein|nr:MAG: hypothetical protein CVU13_04685 [Bacteroidetes bacterium HGW-Bacteroidetes-8]
MKNNDTISKIIFSKLFSKLSKEEEEILSEWLKDDNNKKLYEKILDPERILSKSREYDTYSAKLDKDTINQSFRRLLNPKNRFRAISQYAAILIPLVVIIGTLLLINPFKRVVTYQELCNTGSSPSIVLSNGDKMDISVKNKELISSIGIVIKDTTDLLACALEQDHNKEEIQEIEILTPIGKRMTITLSDGTKVYMNSGSKIKFPTKFKEDSREVFAEGELFFDVTPDKSHPFIVHMNRSKVVVVGTGFNIRSYPDEITVQTTVSSGTVVFSSENLSVNLAPGEQSVFNKISSGIEKNIVEIYDFMAWKEGMFYFNNRRLEDIMSELKKWYGFEYVFDNEVSKHERFGIELKRDVPLDKIIELINSTNTINIYIEGRVIHIK